MLNEKKGIFVHKKIETFKSLMSHFVAKINETKTMRNFEIFFAKCENFPKCENFV